VLIPWALEQLGGLLAGNIAGKIPLVYGEPELATAKDVGTAVLKSLNKFYGVTTGPCLLANFQGILCGLEFRRLQQDDHAWMSLCGILRAWS